jgi:hypothetical protein
MPGPLGGVKFERWSVRLNVNSRLRLTESRFFGQGRIRQIEVGQAVLLGEADRDLALQTIELGLCLQQTLSAASSAAGLGASQVRS